VFLDAYEKLVASVSARLILTNLRERGSMFALLEKYYHTCTRPDGDGSMGTGSNMCIAETRIWSSFELSTY
jgi:hypothetical protein